MAATLAHPALAASDQCLSKPELNNVARMASVMGIGAALQRCGACLGERYRQALDHYEASHLLQDFRTAEVEFRGKGTFDYADGLVRQAARNYAYDLSADCSACTRMADTVDSLTSPEARSKFYGAEAERLGKLPTLTSCP